MGFLDGWHYDSPKAMRSTAYQDALQLFCQDGYDAIVISLAADDNPAARYPLSRLCNMSGFVSVVRPKLLEPPASGLPAPKTQMRNPAKCHLRHGPPGLVASAASLALQFHLQVPPSLSGTSLLR